MKKFIAFTLAETLIVMGIIGIVSALTLPNLNSSTGEKEKVAKVKKIYQNLDDAFSRAEAVYGPLNEWFVNDADENTKANRFGDRLTEFIKVSKNCRFIQNSGGSCWSNTDTKFFNGTNWANIDANKYYKFVLADGTAVATNEATDGNILIHIDIDGVNKGPNQAGKDVFRFIIYDKMGPVKPVGEIGNNSLFKDGCYNGSGFDCTMWVVTNDNMDYLKVGTDGNCKNNTSRSLDWTNITCK